jgi:hypothetical protein
MIKALTLSFITRHRKLEDRVNRVFHILKRKFLTNFLLLNSIEPRNLLYKNIFNVI